MSDTDNPTTEDKKSMSTEEAIGKLREENLLFVDQEGVGHLAVNGNGANVFPTASRDCAKFIRQWLVKQQKRYDINRNTIDAIQQALDCEAEIEGATIPLNVRLAREDNTIFYDLRDGAHAVEISPNGWHIVPTPIKFRSFKKLRPQVQPLNTNSRSLECLRPLVSNLESEDDWLMYQVFLVSLFVPDFPRPLLCVDGVQGAGKSTLIKLTADLVDPSGISSGLNVPRNIEELRRLANHYLILPFDNASRLSPDISDALCSLSTGSSSVRRILYSTEDELIYSDVYRSVLICGIPRVAERADILDRCLSFSLRRIGDTSKQRTISGAGGLDHYYKEHKPEILGAIMNILADALGKVDKVKIKNLPRLADFAVLGYAIAESIEGYNGEMFLTAYKRMRDKSDQFALDASPTAQAIQYLLSTADEWQGTPYELWNLEIKDGHEITPEEMKVRQELKANPYFPKSAATLIKELVRCQATLAAVGIDVECTRNGKSIWLNGSRTVILRKRQQKQES